MDADEWVLAERARALRAHGAVPLRAEDVAERLGVAVLVLAMEKDGWAALAERAEVGSMESKAFGQVQEAARAEGRAEAYREAAERTAAVLEGPLHVWDGYARWTARRRGRAWRAVVRAAVRALRRAR
ncbi:hypothetical protein GEV43_08905 [Actinomadura sp. J1-007]|nr:hypothetical protein [Actinomadura sp. J1-007]